MIEITKTETTLGCVIITLSNGVSFSVTPWKDRIHLHFSGVTPPMTVAAILNSSPEIKTANYLDIGYDIK